MFKSRERVKMSTGRDAAPTDEMKTAKKDQVNVRVTKTAEKVRFWRKSRVFKRWNKGDVAKRVKISRIWDAASSDEKKICENLSLPTKKIVSSKKFFFGRKFGFLRVKLFIESREIVKLSRVWDAASLGEKKIAENLKPTLKKNIFR